MMSPTNDTWCQRVDLAMIARRGEAIRGIDDLRRWAAEELPNCELAMVERHIGAIEDALRARFE